MQEYFKGFEDCFDDALLTIETTGTFWGYNETVDADNNRVIEIAKKSIQGGKVKVSCSGSLASNQTVSNIDLYSNAILEVVALGGDINSNVFNFATGVSNATAQFYFNSTSTDDIYFTVYKINNNNKYFFIILFKKQKPSTYFNK